MQKLCAAIAQSEISVDMNLRSEDTDESAIASVSMLEQLRKKLTKKHYYEIV